MLEGWHLDVDGSGDSMVTVARDGSRRVIEVRDRREVECLAGRPTTGLPGEMAG